MPTLEHNALVEMFRESPELAPHFLALLFHVDPPPHVSAAVVESALDRLIPVKLLADLVIELRDANGALVLAIVLEVQRHEDPDKGYSWPVYVAVVRAKKRCPAVVLVVAPDAAVASWAAQPLDLGLGRGSVRPLVIGPASVPEVTDATVAARETKLAVLSAMAHGNGDNGLAVVEAAVVALDRLDRDHAGVYFHVIWSVLGDPMKRVVEALAMVRQTEGKVAFPPFAERLIERGFREGEIKGKRDALLRLLTRAGIALTDGERARIGECMDSAALDRWVENVLGAKTAADVLS